MTAFIPHSAAQLRRAKLNGAQKRKSTTSPGYGVSVDYSLPIKSCLKNGSKKTPEIAALLGLGAATAYRRLTALAEIGAVIRSKHRGLNAIDWSLPGPDGELVSATDRKKNVTPLTYRQQLMRETLAHK